MNIEEKTLEINGDEVSFKFYPSVNGKEEKTFIILHGWGGKSDSWVDVASILSKNGFNVYIPDLPGHGKTSLTKIFTIDDYSVFVEKFCGKLGLNKFSVIAHSNGGRMFLNLLLKKISHQDENFSGNNEDARIFLEKNKKISTKIAKQFFLEKIFLVGSAGIRPTLNLKQKFIQNCSKLFPVLKKISILRILVLKLIGGQDYLNASKEYNLKETFLNVLNCDLKDKLPQIKEKIHLIWGDNDTYTPLSSGKKMNKLLENSDLTILEGQRHGIHIHSPNILAEKILSKFN